MWHTPSLTFLKIGNHTINASALSGNATINLNAGATNTLAGNILDGAVGNDTYRFLMEDGVDVISEYGASSDDKIVLLTNNNQTAIAFFMNGNHLEIGYTASPSDKITVQNHNISASAIERFELSEGFFMTSSDLNGLLQHMSSYAAENNIALTSLADVQNNNELTNIIAQGWHT